MHNEMCDRLALARPTANRAVITDASGLYATSVTTNTELALLNGLTALIGKQDIYISASAMRATVTAGCSALTLNETMTNKVNYQTLDFDQTTEENAFFEIVLPRNYNNGTITTFFHWTAPVGAGTAAFGIKALARSNDDALDTAFGSEITTTDTLIALGDKHLSPESSAITIGGTPADGDLILFNVARKIASDTLTGDVKLMGVTLVITTDALVSA